MKSPFYDAKRFLSRKLYDLINYMEQDQDASLPTQDKSGILQGGILSPSLSMSTQTRSVSPMEAEPLVSYTRPIYQLIELR
ncbi:hypothetical protein E2C01_004699 [Portunus trituberculatus]|uniref:Uncharacterized protein n=1 Tax=Portunus trituberculatus TaxID=210409 RepID=A0A5B7CQN4_PORTR|nr:hypothetical protein [Portunus trituberculatus]